MSSYRAETQLNAQEISELLQFPLSSPPPGVTPNFDNGPSNALQVYIVCAICLPLLFFSAACKVVGRSQSTRKGLTFGGYLILYSIFGVVLWIAIAIFNASGKCWGRHMWDVKLGFFTKAQVILAMSTPPLYVWNMLTIKTSLLLLYIELFGSKPWLRYWAYAGIAVLTILHLTFVLIWCISCRPRGGFGQSNFIAGMISPHCSAGIDYLVLLSVTTMVGDLFLVILPLPAIWTLHMKTKKKIGVSIMFLSGLCAVAAGIATLVYRIRLVNSKDATWESLNNWTTSIAEMSSGAVVACVPAIAATARKFSKSRALARSSSKEGSGSSGNHSLSSSTNGLNHPQKNRGSVTQQPWNPSASQTDYHAWTYHSDKPSSSANPSIRDDEDADTITGVDDGVTNTGGIRKTTEYHIQRIDHGSEFVFDYNYSNAKQ